jgi:hypothetical protein
MCSSNFEFVPELNHQAGYPFAVVLTLASALMPMRYFMQLGLFKKIMAVALYFKGTLTISFIAF